MVLHGSQPSTIYTIGGKAAGLYELQKMAVAVPPFLVIPAETFDPILSELPTNELTADQRRQRLLAFRLSPADKTSITRILADWGFPAQAVVVRSSVADEDGKANAFAGLMDSFLNLTTLSDVHEAIARCAASAYSERALAYRKHKGLTLAARPAVIIQQQLIPVSSGVLFTTFPNYPQELAIHAVLGFGEGLMNGTLETDEFYYLKQSGRMHRQRIADKTQQQVVHDGPGLQSSAVDAEKRAVPCLTVTQLNELFRIGTILERTFGRAQDVEFVQTDDQVFVVQTRPITQPIPEIIVYDNSNIQESYCGVTTPLTFSFASRAYATVYRQTMQTLGVPPDIIKAHESIVTNLLGLVKGRIYYNINNWYRGLQLLPSFRQNKADMERMMGLEEPVDFVQDRKKTTLEKLRMLPGLAVNLARLLGAFSTLGRRVPAFHTRFRAGYHRFCQQDLSTLSTAALLAEKQWLDAKLLGNWTTPIINDFYVMMTNGQAVRKLRKAGVAQPEEFLSRYLSGDKQIESTQPVRAIYQLAVQVRQQPVLRSLILAGQEDMLGQIQKQYPAFYQAVSQFIDQYGDRTVGELKLETQTMRLAPSVFYQYLRNYLTVDASAESLAGGQTELHTGAAEELTNCLASQSIWFRLSVRRTLAQLQRAIRYRESLRLERTRLFGMYRALYLTLGERLVRVKALHIKEDVFYLTEDEIVQAVSTNETTGLVVKVVSRRTEFARYETEDVSSRVIVPSPPVSPPLAVLHASGTYQGTGCVPGVVTGEVVVITNPRDNLDVAGKIVCALRTDPGWAVLFPTCRAVLIEKGSSLSHSVILLRELGLPTIINIPNLTKMLRTGQTVTMDAGTGEVTIHAHDDC